MPADSFRRDDSAVLGLPMRIVVAAILLAAVLVLSTNAIINFTDEACESRAAEEVDKIALHAAEIYKKGGARNASIEGDFGTVEQVHVSMPGCVKFAIFGAMPAGGEAKHERLDAESNVYYYVLGNGKLRTKSSVTKFSADNLSRAAVLYAGSYSLTLEPIKDGNGTYVMLYTGGT
jgi:hypothetical protein